MIKDRGTKKWTSMMLPEHIGLLRQFADDYYHVEKPIVDEYELVEFDERIAFAMEYNLPVKFTVWEAGSSFERLNMTDIVAVEIEDT